MWTRPVRVWLGGLFCRSVFEMRFSVIYVKKKTSLCILKVWTNTQVFLSNWNLDKRHCLCRNSVMFNNEMMADVHFVVGPAGGTQRVPGHKVKLKEPSAGVNGSCMFVDLACLLFVLCSISMFWPLAAPCSMPCFMESWPRIRMKYVFLMWNRLHSWQC